MRQECAVVRGLALFWVSLTIHGQQTPIDSAPK